MISANNVTYRVGKKALFEDVNIKFTEGNCYGLIGANGAGKSTFLKILSGSLDTTNGDISVTPGQRLSVLEQDHFKYDKYPVMDTVIMGNARLYEIMKEKDAIYAKEDFSDEDGIRASELEAEFAEMDGWNAESDAATLLNGLGIDTGLHYSLMQDLNGSEKVKVLLARALFGNPDILLLDEPTNHLDIQSREILEEALQNYTGTVLYVSHDRYFINQTATRILDLTGGGLNSYTGNYDDYLEKKEHPSIDSSGGFKTVPAQDCRPGETGADSLPTKAAGKDDYLRQKEEQAKERKRQNQIKRIENRIEEIENRINELDELLVREEIATDVEKLMEINQEHETLDEELLALMEEWEALVD